MILKPTKEHVIKWISDALYDIKLDEGVFLRVVLRDLEDLQLKLRTDIEKVTKKSQEQEDEGEEYEKLSGEEDDYELVYEDDYNFDYIE